MSGIVYRNAAPADAPTLAELGKRTFTDTFGHLYKAKDLATFLEKHAPEQWARELADPDIAVRIAEHDGEPIAYAKLGPPTLPVDLRGPSSELRQLYVLRTWHGTGVAETLMAWILAEARSRGARDLYLSVFVDNHRARRFYARYGFEHVGDYAFMVGDHEDNDEVMRRQLED